MCQRGCPTPQPVPVSASSAALCRVRLEPGWRSEYAGVVSQTPRHLVIVSAAVMRSVSRDVIWVLSQTPCHFLRAAWLRPYSSVGFPAPHRTTVLGVGHAAGAESVASGRIMETVVGAIAGVLVNLAFPPPVATRDASRAVTAFAKEIAALLSAAAEALEGGPIPGDLAARGWRTPADSLAKHPA